MPTVYEGTCVRPGCKRSLRHGAKYCSQECARKHRRESSDKRLQGRLPTDDQVWADLKKPWAWWAARCGVDKNRLSRRMRARGWQKRNPYVTVTAPCSVCGQPFRLSATPTTRVCEGCRTRREPLLIREVVRRERARRRPGGDRYDVLYLTARPYTRTRYGLAPHRIGLQDL